MCHVPNLSLTTKATHMTSSEANLKKDFIYLKLFEIIEIIGDCKM